MVEYTKKTGQVQVGLANREIRTNFVFVGQREVKIIKVDKVKYAPICTNFI